MPAREGTDVSADDPERHATAPRGPGSPATARLGEDARRPVRRARSLARAWAVQGLAGLRGHPRHLVLAALVAGLLLGRTSAVAVVAAAMVVAALAGRP